MSTPRIGDTLGHYRIIEELGSGGMGVVFKAQDMRLGRLVALKVLKPSMAGDVESVERFRREARTASSLNHPNICTVYNFDEQGGRLFLAMELLEGDPLDKKLAGKPVDFLTVLELGTQVADALDAAHAEGILHRDIKPGNIFLTRRGQVKVLDFGLAKLAAGKRRGPSDTHLTEHFTSVVGTTAGTVAYMSPEQARGDDLDPRTDLFSFGVVLYEMSTGRQGFPGATTAVIFDGILNREPTAASTLNAAIPSELDRIISKALEKDRTLRYQTAADMRVDLQRLKRDTSSRRVAVAGAPLDPSPATVVFHSGGVTPAAPVAPELPAAPLPPRARVSGLTLAVSALLLIGLVVIAATAWFGNRSVQTTPADIESAPVSPVVSARPAVPDPAAAAVAPPAVTPPVVTPPPTSVAAPSAPAPRKAAPTPDAATARLDIARAKIGSNLLEPALGDLRQILIDFPRSPVAAEASFLSAEILEKLGRVDDAMATHVEIAQRFPTDKRAAASKLRLAELTERSRQPNREAVAGTILDDVIRTYPQTPEALRALQMKIRLDQGSRRRVMDPVLNVQVPPVLPTLRTLTEQFPSSPASMVALNRLASMYEDLGQFERAALAYTQLATSFPDNPNDAWFRAAEIYERRLKDISRAREAYARVPAGTPRYRDAQKKLTRQP